MSYEFHNVILQYMKRGTFMHNKIFAGNPKTTHYIMYQYFHNSFVHGKKPKIVGKDIYWHTTTQMHGHMKATILHKKYSNIDHI